MNIIEVTDIHGHKHKVDLDALDAKRFAKDGEMARFSMMAWTVEGGLFICDSEQLKDHNMTTEYKVTDEQQKRVDDAYKEMCDALDYRSRTRGTPGETADQAFEAARKELEIAWRNGR